MAKVVFFNTYKLKKGAAAEEFLPAVEALRDNYISKCKGFLSFQLMADGDTWADATTFESMEDAQSFAKGSDPGGYAERFYAFLNFNSCQSHFFTVEQG